MKQNKVTRLLTLLLSLVMVLSVTACGSSTDEDTTQKEDTVQKEETVREESTTQQEETVQAEELEPVTLKWVIPGTEKEGTKDVFEAFNAKLAEVLPNTTVEFELTGNDWEFKTPWTMNLAAEETMDIAWAGYATNMLVDVEDGNLLGISDLIEEYAPNIKTEMETWPLSYETSTLDGEIYGIPSIQPSANETQSFKYSKKLEPYLDQEAMWEELNSNSKITEKMLDIIEAALQGAMDDGVIEAGSTSWKFGSMVPYDAVIGYMSLTNGQNYIFVDPEAENCEPLYLWEIPEFKMLVERMAKWYDMGWVTESEILGQIPADAKTLWEFGVNWNENWNGADEKGIKDIVYQDEDWIWMASNKPEEGWKGIQNFAGAATYMVIPYTAKNPERAIMLLDLLHDEPGTVGNDLMNMLVYGFEENSQEAKEYGWCNYTAVEKDGQMITDTTVRGEAASKHSLTNWVMGNTYKIMSPGDAMHSVSNKEYCMDFNENKYPNLQTCAITDLFVDLTDVQTEMQAVQTVYAEYYKQLYYGCGGSEKVDEVMDKALTKLKEAGWDELKAKLQDMIDAHNAQ